MAQSPTSPRQQSHAYNIFVLILTIISLVIMAVMFLPLDDATLGLLRFYDNLICLIFLLDFALSLRAAPDKSVYFFKERGWLDLLGSIPALGVTKYSGLLRLARLSRFARSLRILRRQDKEALVQDISEHRSQYTGLITILLIITILASASVLVLQFEGQSAGSSIKSGGEALWYSLVTITTVGYGDYYPVTPGGRITATFVMIAGVGVIAVLASLLSSLLVGSPSAPAEEEATATAWPPSVEQELAAIKSELMGLRRLIEEKAPEEQ